MSIHGLCLALLIALAGRLQIARPSAPPTDYWTASLDVVSYNYSEAISMAAGKPHQPSHVALAVHSSYTLYQNPKGVVRLELASLGRNRVVEPPIDFTLLDYNTGYKVVWDRDGGDAERSSFRLPVTPVEIGDREILGHLCRGHKYEWQDSRGAHLERIQWLAQPPVGPD